MEVQSVVTFSGISHMYRRAQIFPYISNYTYVDINIYYKDMYSFFIYLGQADISWLPSYQRTIMRICLVHIAWRRNGRGQLGIMLDTTTCRID